MYCACLRLNVCKSNISCSFYTSICHTIRKKNAKQNPKKLCIYSSFSPRERENPVRGKKSVPRRRFSSTMRANDCTLLVAFSSFTFFSHTTKFSTLSIGKNAHFCMICLLYSFLCVLCCFPSQFAFYIILG